MAARRGAPVTDLDGAATRVLRALAGPTARFVGHGRRLARTPLGRRVLQRRVVGIVVAVVAGTTVTGLVSGAERTRERWGPTRPVLVARHDLPAGTALDADAVAVRSWPSLLAPPTAIGGPGGRRLARPVPAGAVLTSVDVAPAGRGPVAAQLRDGSAAVTVARGPAPAPVRPGDLVDLLGLTATTDRKVGGHPLARRAPVVAVDGRSVTVAVDRARAPDVAAAAASGTLVLVVVP